ncbi:MAG: inorganic pyrophosphatase [Chloroflexi bacterium]|nr:MAG: inorganic pyrophosphatase [Chloroflexota bacterium]
MTDFWKRLDELVVTSEIVIDRPEGTAHPRYPAFVYPHDYGYLEGTSSMDGDGIDVWVGSLEEGMVTAVICTIDMTKRDSEMKILLDCTPEEAKTILATHNNGPQSGILLTRNKQI